MAAPPAASVGRQRSARALLKGLLYHYFRSTRGFFVEVVRSAASELLAAIQPDPTLSGPANVRRGLLA